MSARWLFRLVLTTFIVFASQTAERFCSCLTFTARAGVYPPPQLVPAPVVTDLRFDRASVTVGSSFLVTVSGSNLTPETFFDVRFTAPGNNASGIALNWQTGLEARHRVSTDIAIGSWTINGVRPHEAETDHDGNFFPVLATITVDATVWARIGLAGEVITSFAVDPENPGTLYAGIGFGSFARIVKSTDNGVTWTVSTLSGQVRRINDLVIDPKTPSTLYAGGFGGVFKSTDSGETWVGTPLSAVTVTSLVIDPQNSSTIYAGTDHPPRVFKSINGGNTWITPDVAFTEIEPGTGITVCQQYISALAINPLNPSTVYATTSDCNDQGGMLRRSTDGGITWRCTKDGQTASCIGTPFLNVTGNSPIVVDPKEPNTLYAVSQSEGLMFKSTDGGENWGPLSRRVFANSVAIDPQTSSRIYAGSFGSGVMKSIDRGANWIPFNDGLSNFNIQKLVVSPSRPGTLYAVTSRSVQDPGGLFVIIDDTPVLSLDTAQFCIGSSWKLGVRNGPINTSIHLLGTSNGQTWQIRDWGRTDRDGTFSETGIFPEGPRAAIF